MIPVVIFQDLLKSYYFLHKSTREIPVLVFINKSIGNREEECSDDPVVKADSFTDQEVCLSVLTVLLFLRLALVIF